jgi:hypothetical protein
MRATTLERIIPTLAFTALLAVGWTTAAVAADAPPAAAPAKVAKKKAKKKKASAPTEPAADKPGTVAKRRRYGAQPVYLVGDSNAHLINESAPKIVAFPHEAKAVEKAFAETRRDQLNDAEKAARDEKSPDRWRTVLFMLRGLPERTDPEACFWRVLAFYRLGEIDRARAVRESCELVAKDSGVLNAEDATAAGVPAMGSVARQDQFFMPAGATEPKETDPKKDSAKDPAAAAPPSPAIAPYTGPSPQRYK